MLAKSTEKYYQEKINFIYEMIKKKFNSNLTDYEAYMNTPFSKSMIRFKFEYDLEYNMDKINISEGELMELAIDDSIPSLLYSTLTKIKPSQYRDIYLTEYLTESSANEIKEYLDYATDYDFADEITKQINCIKYLYFGEKHIRYISKIIEMNNREGYVGKYKDIKFFYIERLEDIYLSNAAFIDLNTIDVRYNEYIKEEFDDIYDENVLYEDVHKFMKKGVITLNCILGDINIAKLVCHFGEGNQFCRKLKLSRILKNQIEI